MTPLAAEIWNSKYRLGSGTPTAEADIDASWDRVARAVAAIEPEHARFEDAFRSILSGFRFLPGGRILAGAGADRQVTLFSCFVAGTVQDSLESILDSLKETALTMQQGGGIGLDYSLLRPSGSTAARTGATASGPVAFMHTWDALCETLLSTSSRRGAMMATLRCDHPDIETFIDAKRGGHALKNFNLSVLVSDAFMEAVSRGRDWRLAYPAGDDATASSRTRKTIPAKNLWRHLCDAARESAEPGVLFVDVINRNNNLYYCESISATNPCGEIPLPPFGACDLGSLNLTAFVDAPFTDRSTIDRDALADCARTAVRFLDNVIDISGFPLEAQGQKARNTRRIGIGLTGLGDTLAMLGLHYDSDAARDTAASIMRLVRDVAYEESVQLARDKGPFPALDRDRYLEAPFVRDLPARIRSAIAEHGIRNSHLLAIAPAGTISLLAGNVSSGIEPIYALEATRRVRTSSLEVREHDATDYAWALWQSLSDGGTEPPECFVTAEALPAKAHLGMQAALQPFVDNAISKTVNLPVDATVEDVAAVFEGAFRLGLKGCTAFRPGTCTGQVIRTRDR